ncbi:hypothetical protein FUAX_26360 [Fulvitalea axinellae]|uniref:HdeD family acid-resistance protein n=1 Tax=Fulvitalea axinellae TaxID=1182444 RepID=A0AAU9D6R2_9BACT|nr:hypothetical protein FUAX_26360 [Fulvitalea axinellae]
MKKYVYENWWATALKGLAALLFGIFAVVRTSLAFETLVYYFGFLAIISGILVFSGAIRYKKTLPHRGLWIFEGLLDIIIGVIVIYYPAPSAEVLLILMGAWAFATGAMQLLAAFRLHDGWLWGLGGVASIAFALILFKHPIAGAIAITFVIGIYMIILGVFLLSSAFRLRQHRDPF